MEDNLKKRVLAERPLLWVALLGFSSGLPLLLLGSTLSAWYVDRGISLLGVGSLSLIGVPYVCKWLWAPLLHRYAPTNLGYLRVWITSSSLLLAMGFWGLPFLDPAHMPWVAAGYALMLAGFAATLDIAIDGYRTEYLSRDTYSLGAGIHTTFYRIAMVLSGGVALILAERYGWQYMYHLMALVMLVIGVVSVKLPELSGMVSHQANTLRAAVWGPIQGLLRQDSGVQWLWFILLASLSISFFNALAMPFALKELHFSLSFVGSVYKLIGVPITIVGALFAGYGIKRWSYYSVMWFALVGSAIGLLLWIPMLGWHDKTYFIIASTYEHFFWGMMNTLTITLLMGLCQKGQAVTQFAILAAIVALSRVCLGPLVAGLVLIVGWTGYFILGALSIVPALWLAAELRESMYALLASDQASSPQEAESVV